MDSKHWSDQLQKFKDIKRKSAHLDELIILAESMVAKINTLSKDNETLKDSTDKEIDALKKEAKDLRDELDIAWKNSEQY